MEREVILSDGRRLAATEKNGAGDTLVVLVHGWCCRRSDWHAYLESAPETGNWQSIPQSQQNQE